MYRFAANISGYTLKLDSSYPFVRSGVELRLQQRFGMTLAAEYDFGSIEGKYPSGGTAFQISSFSLEPSLSLYF
jgi:hypothetical protein